MANVSGLTTLSNITHTHNEAPALFLLTTMISSTVGKLSFIPMVVVPIHCFHIALVLLKSKLHQTTYYLLVNLSISDSLIGIGAFATPDDKSTLVYVLATSTFFYNASILFTLAITLDRYSRSSMASIITL